MKGVLYIAVLIVIFLIFMCITDDSYEQMGSNVPSSATEKFISNHVNKKRTPLENYRLGSVYDYYYKDDKKATKYYNEAIDQFVNPTPANNRIGSFCQIITPQLHDNREFIIGRIRDRFTSPAIDMMEDTKIKKNIEKIKNSNVTHPKIAKAALEKKVKWTRDNQNVHDSKLASDVKNSYYKIASYNSGANQKSYENVIDYFVNNSSRTKQINSILDVLTTIKPSNTISKLNPSNPVSERKVIADIWTRINAPENKQNQRSLIDSFASSIADCHENGSIVCATGRVSRMVQSLAHLDFDPEVGQVKTKQAVRNEIFASVGNFVTKEYEKLLPEIQQDYVNSIDTPGTKLHQRNVDAFIEKTVTSYNLPKKEQTSLITECLASI
jgi:hypothetical protein